MRLSIPELLLRFPFSAESELQMSALISFLDAFMTRQVKVSEREERVKVTAMLVDIMFCTCLGLDVFFEEALFRTSADSFKDDYAKQIEHVQNGLSQIMQQTPTCNIPQENTTDYLYRLFAKCFRSYWPRHDFANFDLKKLQELNSIESEKLEHFSFFGETLVINKQALACSLQGVDKYNSGDYLGAVASFSQAINLTSDNDSLYTVRGTAYEDHHDYINAKKDFEKALMINSRNYLAAYRLGMIYSQNNDIVNASNWLFHSYQNANLEVPHMLHVGWSKNCLFFVGKHLIANNLALQCMRANLPAAAVPYLEHAIKIDSGYANGYYGLALAKNSLGANNEAVALMKKAASLGHSQASLVLANMR